MSDTWPAPPPDVTDHDGVDAFSLGALAATPPEVVQPPPGSRALPAPPAHGAPLARASRVAPPAPPPMTSMAALSKGEPRLAAREALVALFRERKIAFQARTLRLIGLTVTQAHRHLYAQGFVMQRKPLLAERGPSGNPQFRLAFGGSTPDPTDPDVVHRNVYAHVDGTLVSVFTAGDPLGRLAPTGRPSATKAVCFVPMRIVATADGRSAMVVDISEGNLAFFVDAEGEPLPAGRRRADGNLALASPQDEHRAVEALAARRILLLGT